MIQLMEHRLILATPFLTEVRPGTRTRCSCPRAGFSFNVLRHFNLCLHIISENSFQETTSLREASCEFPRFHGCISLLLMTVTHQSELTLLFGPIPAVAAVETAFSNQMRDFYINFVNDLNPGRKLIQSTVFHDSAHPFTCFFFFSTMVRIYTSISTSDAAPSK